VWGPWTSHAAVGEAYANLRQRNQFATLLNVGLAAGLWQVGSARRYMPIALLCALLELADAASASRTGLLQLLFTTVLCVWWTKNVDVQRRDRVRLTVLVALLGYLVASIALPLLMGLDLQHSGILSRFQENGAGCQSRLTLWSNVLHLIVQKPLLGWGWGELSYAHFYTLYPGERFCDILDNAHNLPLHLAVELGIPLAIVLSSVAVWLVVREEPWREQQPMRQMAWTILALIGLHSLLEYPLWYGPFQMTVVLCIYLLWRVPASWQLANAHESSERVIGPTAAKGISLLAVMLLAGCAYAAWDYWRISQIYTVQTQRAPAYRDDTLRKIQDSWLFQNQVRFAELNVTPLTKDNAEHINALAKEMLHFSPEPAVVKKLIESSTMLGREEEAAFYLQRSKAAFPNSKL
jgi:hypothetical protein